jgi:hypothetical protein
MILQMHVQGGTPGGTSSTIFRPITRTQVRSAPVRLRRPLAWTLR